MPHSSHTQQTKTHARRLSPRLCNDDLAPTRDQNWSWYNIFSFWMSDAQHGRLRSGGELLLLGLASWQVLLCLLVGICIVQLCANLGGEAEPDGRGALRGDLSSGVWRFRRQYPGGDPRADRLCPYGIQTHLAANALMLVLLKFWPSLASLTSSSFRAINARLVVLRHYVAAAGDGVLAWHERHQTLYRYRWSGGLWVMLALAGWIVYKTGLDGISFTLASKSLSAGEQTDDHRHGAGGPYFGPLLNFGDFSRHGSSMGEIRRGNRWGLPFNFLLFSVVTVVIVSGTQSLFGKMITDPIETVSRVGNDLAVAIGLLTMITATIGINIVANFVSPAFDFSNCAPQKISFRTGGMIAAVGSILLTPWNLFNSPELIHYTLDVLGAFIGPLFGILIADFYLIKRGRVSVDDLFDDTPQGKYWYRNGFNPKAIAALLPSVGLGLIISFIPALHEVANFSWFIGVPRRHHLPLAGSRRARSAGESRLPPGAVAQKSNLLLPRRLAAAGCNWHQSCCLSLFPER